MVIDKTYLSIPVVSRKTPRYFMDLKKRAVYKEEISSSRAQKEGAIYCKIPHLTRKRFHSGELKNVYNCQQRSGKSNLSRKK
jgi:hypothetical protein